MEDEYTKNEKVVLSLLNDCYSNFYISKLENTLKLLNTNSLIKLIKLNSKVFSLVQKEQQTPEMCFIAVELSGFNLQYVRDDLQTRDISMVSMKHTNTLYLHSVKPEFITGGFCLELLNHHFNYNLRKIKDLNDLTEEQLTLLVIKYPELLKFIDF